MKKGAGVTMMQSKGFTLVELMVTIAVLAIIAMMAVPTFVNTVRKNQLNSETQDFINLLAEIRSEAIFKQKNRTAKLSDNIWKVFDQTDKEITTFNFLSMTNTSKSAGVTSLTFNRLGQSVAASDQCLIFQHSKDSKLKSVVFVQREGIVSYDKTLTNCPS